MVRHQRNLLWVFALCLLVIFPVNAQEADPAAVPDLTETFEGRGRLDEISFDYPDGWFTLEGIPVNRLISFNVVSSVQIGVRNQIEPGEEALVFALAGGRVDRWPTIDADFTPEEILNAFFERLGDGGDQFGGDQGDDSEGMEAVVEEITIADQFDAVIVRFVEAEASIDEEASEDDTETVTDADAEEEDFNGEFIAYSIRLDDNRFMILLVLTSEFTYEEAAPTIDAILDTFTLTP